MATELNNTEVKKHKRNALITYFQESYQELGKVTWPTRNQAVKLTFLVLGFCLVTAVIVGALDFAFNFGHQYLISIAPDAPIQTAAPQVNPVAANAVATDANGNSVPLKIDTTPVTAGAGTTPAGAPAPATPAPTPTK